MKHAGYNPASLAALIAGRDIRDAVRAASHVVVNKAKPFSSLLRPLGLESHLVPVRNPYCYAYGCDGANRLYPRGPLAGGQRRHDELVTEHDYSPFSESTQSAHSCIMAVRSGRYCAWL